MPDAESARWSGTEIAVVGMAGRFPDAPDLDAFWRLLREGREASRTFGRAELIARGVPAEVADDPRYVARGPVLDGVDLFDAAFFGLSPRDAAIMDPQHRLFLECAWEALEHAGYDPARTPGAVGVFAGAGMHAYLIYHLATNPALMASVGEFLVRHTGNDKDFLATRVSYEFDLRGPSVNVQTACSTSLVAVHYAVQSLLAGESDLALAGAVTVALDQEKGYLYEPGEILSPDGHCRAFDADAAGTVFGSGVGIVVLKRLADALRHGDTIHAVLLGSAVNNDGRRKVGYLAPSVDGQAAVVAEALAVAGLEPRDVSYVEAHGTGTPVGDPIEVAALAQVFGEAGGRGSVGLGSIKTNVGHLDTAAGVASLMKAALALKHREIPATLHFRAPNSSLGLEEGPFYVVDRLRPWEAPDGRLRRAGVSSLGVGGTNAHVIVEEPPEAEASGPSRPHQLLALSARNEQALAEATGRLAAHLRAHPEQPLPDVAHTLHVGRKAFAQRRFAVAGPGEDAAAVLADPSRLAGATAPPGGTRVAFLFAGGGAQHPGMGRDLYAREPVFRAAMDEGLALLAGREGLDLRPHLFPAPGAEDEAAVALARPSLGLPALFLVQHALAELWASWGVRPAALVGHSAGEYAAAVRAGVMTFPDALALVAVRGRLFETLPPGGMLSVALDEADLRPRLDGTGLDVAAVNAPGMSVVAGPVETLDAFEAALAAEGVDVTRVHIDVAAHSSQVEGILDEFRAFVATIPLRAPEVPLASNLTGAWLTADEATDPDYWTRHLRHTVRFADGLATLLGEADLALLEVGPGRTLATLARQHPGRAAAQPVVPSMRHPREAGDDQAVLLRALGQLWAAGADVDWPGFYAGERRRRVPLPTYPFQRQRYWIERGQLVASAPPGDSLPVEAAPATSGSTATPDLAAARRGDVADWLSVPVWGEAPPAPLAPVEGDWLFFDDGSTRVAAAVEALEAGGARVERVRCGGGFGRADDGSFTLRPGAPADYAALLNALAAEGRFPRRIVHACATAPAADPTAAFFSVYHLARALAEHDPEAALHLDLVTAGAQRATDGEAVPNPAGALLLGPARVLPAEFDGLTTRFLDLDEAADGAALAEELARRPSERAAVVALRGGRRRAPRLEPERLAPAGADWVKPGGAYLVTGALGGIGLTLARHLARTPGVRLALLGRSAPGPGATAALRAMEEAGAEVLLLRADVTDRAAMAAALGEARRRFGRLDAVVHAAGVLDDAPLALKEPERAARVLAPKVQGTLVLTELLADDPPDALILCSSTSARLGLPGQADYAAANAFLDAFAASATGPARVLSVGWGAWREVGMTAALAGDAVDPALAEATCAVPVAHPLLCLRSEGPDAVFEATIRETDWVAGEHRLADGRAILPGTALAELARAAAAEVLEGPVELRGVVLRAPAFVDGEATIRVRLAAEGDDLAFTVASASGGRWTVHATGHARPAPPAPPPESVRIPASGEARTFSDERPFEPQPGRLRLGSRWRALRRLHRADGEVTAELALPDGLAPEAATFGLHPALLDLATGAALSLARACDGLWVPLGYDRVASWAPIPARAVVRARPSGEMSDGLARFDLTLIGEGGAVVAAVEGLTMRCVASEALVARRAGDRLAEVIENGIGTAEGIEALGRLLASGRRGEAVVSPLPLEALAARPPARVAPGHAAPHTGDGVAHEAPRDEIEAFLASQWRELLGAGAVGRHDDFFELGGHSLLALRLFARIEKRFGHALPLATLFEAPTVARLAERLRGRPAPAGDGARTAAPALPPTATPPSFAHLVLIRPAADGAEGDGAGGAAAPSASPFYIVHGAGGNVLNFRDLALRLGPERAVYGLQARGVDGRQPPHGSIPEMAAAYLAEVRAVQPAGPYVLGGYSGGGVIAFEMAHRLRAAGEAVAAVVLLDTFVPGIAVPEGRTAGGRLRRLLADGPSYAASWARERAAFERWRLRRLLLSLPRRRGRAVPASLREVQLTGAFHAAADAYGLRRLDAPVVLFTAAGRPAGLGHVGPDLGWSAYAGRGLEVRVSSGTHDDLVRAPHVGPLAEALTDVLRATTRAAEPDAAAGPAEAPSSSPLAVPAG